MHCSKGINNYFPACCFDGDPETGEFINHLKVMQLISDQGELNLDNYIATQCDETAQCEGGTFNCL